MVTKALFAADAYAPTGEPFLTCLVSRKVTPVAKPGSSVVLIEVNPAQACVTVIMNAGRYAMRPDHFVESMTQVG
jgi:hypothetical protein